VAVPREGTATRIEMKIERQTEMQRLQTETHPLPWTHAHA
jgi:hypothetical protein